MKWGLNWFLIEIGFEIYWSSVLNSLVNSKWTRSSFLKLESSRKQLGNHTSVCKPATIIQQFYFTGDSRFFVSGVNINFKVQSKFLTSAEVISHPLFFDNLLLLSWNLNNKSEALGSFTESCLSRLRYLYIRYKI